MPLSPQEKADRKEYIRRQMTKNQADITKPDVVFAWMEDHKDELDDSAGVAAFLKSERDTEVQSKVNECKTFLEGQGYLVQKTGRP